MAADVPSGCARLLGAAFDRAAASNAVQTLPVSATISTANWKARRLGAMLMVRTHVCSAATYAALAVQCDWALGQLTARLAAVAWGAFELRHRQTLRALHGQQQNKACGYE